MLAVTGRLPPTRLPGQLPVAMIGEVAPRTTCSPRALISAQSLLADQPTDLERFVRTVAAQSHRPQVTASHCLGSHQARELHKPAADAAREPKPFSLLRRRAAAEI